MVSLLVTLDSHYSPQQLYYVAISIQMLLTIKFQKYLAYSQVQFYLQKKEKAVAMERPYSTLRPFQKGFFFPHFAQWKECGLC